MSEQKVGFLRVEDAQVEELDHVSKTVENELGDEYNIVVMNDQITWADPEEMMEMFLHMFTFIEANCFEDKAEAQQAITPNQSNLKHWGFE